MLHFLGPSSPLRCSSDSGDVLAPFTFEKFNASPPKVCDCEDGSLFIPEAPDVKALTEAAQQAASEIPLEAVAETVSKFMSDLQTSCPGW